MTDSGAAPEVGDVGSLAAHWTSRFVENGVPLDDLNTTVGGIERWEQWCDAWERTGDANAVRADTAEADGSRITAAELRLVAALEYHFAKFLFVHEPDTLRSLEAKAVSAYRTASPDLPWPGERLVVDLDGVGIAGVLRSPPVAGAAPTVLIVPGLDATKEELHRFSDVFLRRGLATFALDGPGQGEAELVAHLRPDWEVVASQVLDALSAHPRVDPERLGAVGVSLGGYFVARAAVSERRLGAVACIGGCDDLGASWSGLSTLSRRAFEARVGAHSQEEAQKLAGQFTLADAPGGGRAPILVVHGARDRLFVPDQARAVADRFGSRATLLIEERGNHVLHNLAFRVRPAVADWVVGRLSRPGDAVQTPTTTGGNQ